MPQDLPVQDSRGPVQAGRGIALRVGSLGAWGR